jgi:hypothetical protein
MDEQIGLGGLLQELLLALLGYTGDVFVDVTNARSETEHS